MFRYTRIYAVNYIFIFFDLSYIMFFVLILWHRCKCTRGFSSMYSYLDGDGFNVLGATFVVLYPT